MKMKEVFLVEGMSCALCESKVEKSLLTVEGVLTAKADLQTATLALEYDSAHTSLDVIKSTLDVIGYKIAGQIPTTNKHMGSDEAVS